MDFKQIKSALFELNQELIRLDVRGEVCILGGAVMCLVFKTRESTQDIDAIMEPADIIQKAAFNVSETLGLDNNFWLNDAVKVFNSDHAEFADSGYGFSNLVVLTASAEYMFAMKLLSARAGTHDESDILFLKDHLKIRTQTEALKIIQRFYPEQKLSLDSKAMLRDLFT